MTLLFLFSAGVLFLFIYLFLFDISLKHIMKYLDSQIYNISNK